MWHDLWVATALLLVIEGVFPAINPQAFRQSLVVVAQASDRTLRLVGLLSLIAGALILYVVNG